MDAELRRYLNGFLVLVTLDVGVHLGGPMGGLGMGLLVGGFLGAAVYSVVVSPGMREDE